jgi:hypothetical protein
MPSSPPRKFTVVLALLALSLVPSSALAQQWNDGSPARLQPAVLQKRNFLVRVEGSGTVTRSPDGAVYDPGTVVTLTATAATGATFQNWKVNGAKRRQERDPS